MSLKLCTYFTILILAATFSLRFSNAGFKKYQKHLKKDQPPFDHEKADPKRPYYAIRELILEIHGDNKNFHSEHQLPSTFYRHVDPVSFPLRSSGHFRSFT
jgi:hypothetical protein